MPRRLGRRALVALAGVGLLIFVGGTVNRLGLWRLEGQAGFGVEVPRSLPDGMTLASSALVPSAYKGTPQLVELHYTGVGRASLVVFESAYPIVGEGLPRRSRTVILETGAGDGMVLQGFRHVDAVYVEAEAVGVDEPSFARSVASLQPLDGGWPYVLFAPAKR